MAPRGVGELGAQEARQREAVGRRLLAVGGRLGAAQVEVGQIAVAAELGVELGEGVEGLGVGVLDVERGAVGVDGLLGLGELDALEAGDGVQGLQAIVVGAVVERGAVERDALGVARLLDEERVDGGEERALLGLELVGAAVPGERAADLAEVGVDLAGAAGELGARGVVGRERRQLGGVDLGEALLGAGHLGEALQLGPHALVVELLVEELGDRLQRGGVVLELLLVEGGEAGEEIAALARILAGGEARGERGLDLGPVGAAQVDRLEHLARAGLVLGIGRAVRAGPPARRRRPRARDRCRWPRPARRRRAARRRCARGRCARR